MDAMLASMPAWRLEEWKVFYELEPDGDARNEWGFAHIVQSIMRDGKTPLSDYKIPFGDAPDLKKERRQSIEYQTRMITSWISTSNALFKQEQDGA